MNRKKIIIMGALGMDFHTFNTVFKDNREHEIVAFTIATSQNVGTTEDAERTFPAELAGSLYPEGIPMVSETKLKDLIRQLGVEEVVFAYSDASHEDVMHGASIALAAGADFRLISGKNTMIKARKPVISVCAVRTGCGKSQVSRAVYRHLKKKGYKAVAIREPMPYGNLVKQAVMRFATYDDLDKHDCTIEEREEYEPYIDQGLVIYSGLDYAKILEQAEKEADVIVFDGGNNEISFYVPDLLFVVADPLRPGHELKYHPGEVNARSADVFVINKINSARSEDVDVVVENLSRMNPRAKIVRTNSIVSIEKPELLNGKKVIVVEDGPTLTHGGMSYGAGYIAAMNNNAEIIDPRPYLTGTLVEVFKEFPHLAKLIPAMGYSPQQVRDLENTLNKAECDIVLDGSPIDLCKLIQCNKPVLRVTYDIEALGSPTIEEIIDELLHEYFK
ncbi:MAG: cyclic 2,3-diphosphoglycerate synthase [Candidatus Helarchaeota archaeon]